MEPYVLMAFGAITGMTFYSMYNHIMDVIATLECKILDIKIPNDGFILLQIDKLIGDLAKVELSRKEDIRKVMIRLNTLENKQQKNPIEQGSISVVIPDSINKNRPTNSPKEKK